MLLVRWISSRPGIGYVCMFRFLPWMLSEKSIGIQDCWAFPKLTDKVQLSIAITVPFYIYLTWEICFLNEGRFFLILAIKKLYLQSTLISRSEIQALAETSNVQLHDILTCLCFQELKTSFGAVCIIFQEKSWCCLKDCFLQLSQSKACLIALKLF